MCPSCIRIAGLGDARLHRRIQSVDQIAKLAESRVSCHAAFAKLLMLSMQIILVIDFQATGDSPRVPKLGSGGLTLAPDDEDACPTCLEPYTDGEHGYHLMTQTQHLCIFLQCCRCRQTQWSCPSAIHLAVTADPTAYHVHVICYQMSHSIRR